jgi:hypothetical protein
MIFKAVAPLVASAGGTVATLRGEGRNSMERSRTRARIITALGAGILAGSAGADVTVVITSGNGSPGDPDALVSFASYGDFDSHEPTPPDFAAARTGTAADVLDAGAINQDNDCWHLLNGPAWSDADASYSTEPGSALFAAPFDVPDEPLGGATITIEYMVDNFLGGFPPVPGVYINETAVPGSTDFFCPDGTHGVSFSSGTLEIADAGSYVVPGQTNWLYLNIEDSNDDGPGSGVLFGLRLTIPTPCNDADLSPPFGLLDLADISAFVDGFLSMDPIADLDGNGFYDLADVGLFVDAFVAGCP